MEENKLRIALEFGESMFARRTLMQVATKLAIGLGALFLVGVLLAAIPNHRVPVVADPSTGREAQVAAPVTEPTTSVQGPKSHERESAQGVAHRHAPTAKATASIR